MKKAKWIWRKSCAPDEYTEFTDSFDHISGNAYMDISSDSNYNLYINGELISYGQYLYYPKDRMYDRLDITKYLRPGSNELYILVWYYGKDSQIYIKSDAGLIYEVSSGDKVLAYSGTHTLSRLCSKYENYQCKNITSQMGFTFSYVPGAEAAEPYGQSVLVNQNYNLIERPIEKIRIAEKRVGERLSGKKHIFDIGCESAGYFFITYKAPVGVKLTISFGEHLADGEVRRVIGIRDFSFFVTGSGEREEYTNFFRRVGARYFQVEGDGAFEVESIAIAETNYPLDARPFKSDSALREEIYRISLRTLRLCMHDHYEDCPWREQAFYTLDSRNQMLCGYYAFENSFNYVKSNLMLIAKGQNPNGSLPICFPSGVDIVIPFFGLVYLLQVGDYVKYSNDTGIISELEGTLEKMLSFYEPDGSHLIKNFKNCWNFFEWSDGLSSATETAMVDLNGDDRYALPLQCMSILAFESMNELYRKIGSDKNLDKKISLMREAVWDNFFDHKKKLFRSYKGEEHFSKLCNAFAVLAGCARDYKEQICEHLTKESSLMTEATLSMKLYIYDALLTCGDKYKDYILQDIDENYFYMLKNGATSFWETIKGEKDFGGAGSLCHGWSALPIYYYNILNDNKNPSLPIK